MATNRAIMRVEACADPMPRRTDGRRSPLPMLRPSYILLRLARPCNPRRTTAIYKVMIPHHRPQQAGVPQGETGWPIF